MQRDTPGLRGGRRSGVRCGDIGRPARSVSAAEQPPTEPTTRRFGDADDNPSHWPAARAARRRAGGERWGWRRVAVHGRACL